MLKKTLSLRAGYLLLIGVMALVVSPAAGAGDEFQYRVGATFVGEIVKHWKGTMETEASYDERGRRIKNYNDVGVAYLGLSNWFDLGGNYRTVFRELADGTWARENLYYLNFNARDSRLGIGFSHRIRLEYNQWEQRIGDFGTARYRIGVNAPFELDPVRERRLLKDYKLRPFCTYELFYNTLDNYIARHHFKAGLSARITQRIIGNLAYTREESRSRIDDRDLNVLGLHFKLLF
jgi:hypothetical protein